MENSFYRCVDILVTLPVPELSLEIELEEAPGLVDTLVGNIEAQAAGLMLAECVFIISTPSRSAGRLATLKARITGGTAEQLRGIASMARSRRIFEARSPSDAAVLRAAQKLASTPLSEQKKLVVTMTTWDAPGLMAQLTKPILDQLGTIIDLTATTINSGKDPGTADYTVELKAGFATIAQAKRAERLLNQLSVRELLITRHFIERTDLQAFPRAA